jgi:hypothetical protein
MRKPSAVPMSSYTLRTYRGRDAAKVDELALTAFDQFRSKYSDWPRWRPRSDKCPRLPTPEKSSLPTRRTDNRSRRLYPSGTTQSRLLRSVVADHSDARRRSHLPRQRCRPCPDGRMHEPSTAGRIARDCAPHQPNNDCCAADVYSGWVFDWRHRRRFFTVCPMPSTSSNSALEHRRGYPSLVGKRLWLRR